MFLSLLFCILFYVYLFSIWFSFVSFVFLFCVDADESADVAASSVAARASFKYQASSQVRCASLIALKIAGLSNTLINAANYPTSS